MRIAVLAAITIALTSCHLLESRDPTWGAPLPLYPSIPIPVSVGKTIHKKALEYAIGMFNRDCEILRVTSIRTPRIRVQREPNSPNNLAGSARYFKGSKEAYIAIYGYGPNVTHEYLTLGHEFGHSLGLSHDEWRLSIMYPVIRLETSSQWPLPMLTRTDRAWIKEHYCK